MELVEQLRNLNLTVEDFETLITGIEAIPQAKVGGELTLSIMETLMAAGSSPSRIQELKGIQKKRTDMLMQETEARKDDFTILKSKLILMKRALLESGALQQVQTILNTPPRNIEG